MKSHTQMYKLFTLDCKSINHRHVRTCTHTHNNNNNNNHAHPNEQLHDKCTSIYTYQKDRNMWIFENNQKITCITKYFHVLNVISS